jgi:hypothetical protein
LVGNLATEVVMETLKRLGAGVPELESLERLSLMSRGLEARFGAKVQ